MFDHVGIAVSDLAASERFYRTVLSALGVEPGYAGPGSWNDGSSFPPEGLTSRHNNGAEIGMIDGTVQWITTAQYQQELNQYPGPFWCDPSRPDGR